MKRRHFILNSAATSGLWNYGFAAVTSKFPDRPIVIVDPATAGSGTDFFSRPLAEEMGKLLDQVVFVENKTGAGGAIAAEFVARAKPDGHTLGLAAVSTHAANPALNRALRYDPVKDFAPITTMVTLPSVTVVSADSPIRTLKDLIDGARANPLGISFASPGVGSAGHILLEEFSRLAAVKFLHVPYRGSSGMLNDLLGRQLHAASDNIPALLPHIRSGKLRPLAVRDISRIVQLPGIPTLAELGFESVSFPLWFGLVAPAGTPGEVINRLNDVAQEAMRTPSFQRKVEEGAATYSPSTPEQFQVQIQRWFVLFKNIVDSAGIRAE